MEAAAPQTPNPPNEPVPDLRGETGLPRGARIAGVILMINAVFVFAELFLPGTNDPGAGPLNSPVHIIIDLAIGFALARGVAKWQKIAVARVLLGVLLFTGVSLAKQDWIGAGSQVLFSTALLGLLWGNAGTVRFAASLVGIAVVFLAEGIGLYALSTGKNPLSRVVLSLGDDIEPNTVTEVHGERSAWRVDAPAGRWYLRKGPAAAKDNALVDRWLVDPAHDAHLLVIGAPLEPDAKPDVDQIIKSVVDEVKEGSSAFKVVEPSASFQSEVGPARWVHTASTVNNLKIETLSAVVVGKTMMYELSGFAPPDAYATVADDLKQMIRSLKLK